MTEHIPRRRPIICHTCSILTIPIVLILQAFLSLYLCYKTYELFNYYIINLGYIYHFLIFMFTSWVLNTPRWFYHYMSSHPSIVLTLMFGPSVLSKVLYTKFLNFKKYNSNISMMLPKKKNNNNTNKLLQLSASALSILIKKKEVTVEALTRICIQEVKEKNKYLNAVVATRYIEAILEAKKLDNYLTTKCKSKKDMAKLSPLFGIPIVIKECFEMEGMPYTGGIVGRTGIVGKKISTTVEQAINHGMIVLGTSNISEGCMFHESNNLIYGQTNNPYNLSRSPGGSSGGCAAICAAGAVPLVICSDVGGSIRIPSFFCGLFGHKPTGGMVSNENTYPLTGPDGVDRFCQLGPVARHAEDLYPFLKILKKPSKKLMDPKNVDLKNITIFVVEKPLTSYLLRSKLDPELKSACDYAVNVLKDHVKDVKYITMGNFASGINSFSWWGANMDTEKPEPFIDTITEGLGNCDNDIIDDADDNNNYYYYPTIEVVKAMFGITKTHTMPAIGLGALEMLLNLFPNERVRLLKEFKEEKKKMDDLLNNTNAVLIYPTLPTTAFYHHEGLIRFFDVANTCIMNALEYPATNIPLGISKENGMPLGVQCASTQWNDHKTIAIAKFLEEQGVAYWSSPN